jgi:tRNA modification GTPase
VKHSDDDTIAAIATPAGVGGIGIVRLSGSLSASILSKIFISKKASSGLESHRLYHGWISAGQTKIDEVLVSFMAGPNSYTGDDVAEISCHGGRLVVKKILDLVLSCGARLAENGEFTKRAFLSGRLDLAQAEAVVDLISAKSGAALGAASAQLGGELSRKINSIRGRLIELLSKIEAAIDFPEDLDPVAKDEMTRQIKIINKEIGALLDLAEEGRLVREGVRVAIIGKPNVGKSSLLNCLLLDERAIVSPLPGTTRDTIEEEVSLDSVAFVLVDTAGIRSGGDQVEVEGMARTFAETKKADIVLLVVDASLPLSPEDDRVLAEAGPGKILVVYNKTDLGTKARGSFGGGRPSFMVSALSGEGLAELKRGLVREALGGKKLEEISSGVINTRHKGSLFRAQDSLMKITDGIEGGAPQDLIAIDVRGAIMALGEVSGQQVSEEVIEQVFQNFCVGK